MKLYPLISVFVSLVVMTGCSAAVTPETAPEATVKTASQTPESSPTEVTTTRAPATYTPPAQTTATRPARPTPAGTTLYVETVPPPAEDAPVIGEALQELLEEVITDLLQRSDNDRQSINIVRAQATVWNDGSLGCPEPGAVYTQALVNGYWVVLEADGQTYDYRATEAGAFRLCQQGAVDLSVPGPPGTSPEQ